MASLKLISISFYLKMSGKEAMAIVELSLKDFFERRRELKCANCENHQSGIPSCQIQTHRSKDLFTYSCLHL